MTCCFAVPAVYLTNPRAEEIGDTYAVLLWDFAEYQSINTTSTVINGEFRGFKVHVQFRSCQQYIFFSISTTAFFFHFFFSMENSTDLRYTPSSEVVCFSLAYLLLLFSCCFFSMENLVDTLVHVQFRSCQQYNFL